jgi:diaminopimelate epimerase
MNKIHFYKMHGAGNDFVLFDNTSASLNSQNHELFRKICEKHFGVGADGVMLVERSDAADFRLRYYNSDGNSGEMCGNGARCAIWLAHHLNIISQSCRFEINHKIYSGRIISSNAVRLEMKEVEILLTEAELRSIITKPFNSAMWIDVGVPHLVLTGQFSLEGLDIIHLGKHFRNHKKFQPIGTNVNFVNLHKSQNSVSARVYERGVENETLSCGTGAIACAAFFYQSLGWSSPITVEQPGGNLEVVFAEGFKDIFLTGPVALVFEGDLNISSLRKIL